ncbi:MAG: hypothetical protein IPM95_02460 [Sphingobacteriales bacterium]|nr:hypothetical protein [Sphingobacteriales bacterium]
MSKIKKYHPGNLTASKKSTPKENYSGIKFLFSNKKHLHYTLLTILTFCLYGWTGTFDYGFSDQYVLSALNNLDNTFKGFLNIFKQTYAGSDYRPVTVLSFWLERYLFNQTNPHISHLVNVLLLAAILIKLYDLILLSRFYADENKLIVLAMLTSLFFLIHPNHVSVVANIKSRDNLLSMLFGVLACMQIIRLFDLKQYWRIALSSLYLLLAIFSKLDSGTLILVPILLVLFYRKTDNRTMVKYIAITVTAFFIASVLRNLFLQLPSEGLNAVNVQFDKNPIVADDTFIHRISLALTSLYYYLKFLLIPWGYHFIFGYNQIPLTGLFSIPNTIVFTVLLVFFSLAIIQFKKNKIYLFALLFYLFSISFALNLVTTIVGIVSDRHNFIPSLAFCLALAALFTDLYKAESFSIFKKPVLISLVMVYLFFTIYRTKDWKNNFTLVEHDLPYLTESVNAHRIAAATYCNEALSEEMKPSYDRTYTDQLIQKAEQYAIKGLEIYEPVVELWEIKGLCSLYKKDYQAALTNFIKCRNIDSNYLGAINYIGFTYWKLNNTDSAFYYFDYVVKREPFFGYSANNMVDMLIANNQKREADSILHYLKQRFPEDNRLNRKLEELK